MVKFVTFNRTSVELKLKIGDVNGRVTKAFNRTSVELKHDHTNALTHKGEYAFNRTSVELKPYITAALIRRGSHPPFNRTSVELKLSLLPMSARLSPPFNRTSVELKRFCGCGWSIRCGRSFYSNQCGVICPTHPKGIVRFFKHLFVSAISHSVGISVIETLLYALNVSRKTHPVTFS